MSAHEVFKQRESVNIWRMNEVLKAFLEEMDAGEYMRKIEELMEK